MQLTSVREPVSLDKFAYDAIKESILSFALLPGQSLLESTLAEHLGISKTPVRSALLQLEKEGLVVKSHYKGAVVAELSPHTMIELFEVRSALEGLAARLAAKNITAQALQSLQQIVDQELEALEQRHITDASSSNVQFHALLIDSSNNDWLKRIIANLEDHLRRYRVLSNYQKGRLDKSVVEHQNILSALTAHDEDRAETAMKEHLISVMRDLDHEDLQNLINNVEKIET